MYLYLLLLNEMTNISIALLFKKVKECDIWIFLRIFEVDLLTYWITAFSAFIERKP